jgi:DNA-binding CsgD family transcriptional regulator
VRDVDELIAELQAREREFGDHLLAGVARSVPRRYRLRLFEEYAVPYMRMFLPVALDCMRRGVQPDPAVLLPITVSSADRAREGTPLLVLLAMVRGAIGAFSGFVIAQAGPRRLAAAVVVIGRAATVSHDLARAATDGYAAATDRYIAPPLSEAPPPVIGTLPRQVLQLAAQGRSTKEIARALQYSEQAVTYHLGKLMEQFGVPNRTALVARAVHLRLVDVPDEGGAAAHA